MACPVSLWSQSLPLARRGRQGRPGVWEKRPLQHPGQRRTRPPRQALGAWGPDSQTVQRKGLLRGAGWGPDSRNPHEGQHVAFRPSQLRVGFARVAGL